jgi:hypothetical protein
MEPSASPASQDTKPARPGPLARHGCLTARHAEPIVPFESMSMSGEELAPAETGDGGQLEDRCQSVIPHCGEKAAGLGEGPPELSSHSIAPRWLGESDWVAAHSAYLLLHTCPKIEAPVRFAPSLTWTFLSGWGDLNSRPLDPQSSALTKLRHSPYVGRRAYLSGRPGPIGGFRAGGPRAKPSDATKPSDGGDVRGQARNIS